MEVQEDKQAGVKRDYVELKAGKKGYLGCNNALMPSDEEKIFCNWREMPRHVRNNDLIYVDDGKIILMATESDDVRIRNGKMGIEWYFV